MNVNYLSSYTTDILKYSPTRVSGRYAPLFLDPADVFRGFAPADDGPPHLPLSKIELDVILQASLCLINTFVDFQYLDKIENHLNDLSKIV